MSDPYEPPRPRDDALESELKSLHQQEEEGQAKSAIVTATDLPPRPAQLFAVTQKRTS